MVFCTPGSNPLGITIWLSALYKAAGSAQMPASEDRVFP